ncbi:tetratricopeptide (TPR) repeat protein [Dyella sp. SG562]|uniref:tetratricopeptide repeat protein n=1 Tax=Dyella sp. SG562 TaxID=2587017 RepID=UPI0014210B5C|nr:tetratricopeptide repeat protein [Dyella sp. SG562]NII74876.1 tetratricopeptide (TPR) repeat protein [Dyella sp. SG562]
MDRLIQLRDFHRQDPGNDLIVIDLVDALLAHGLLDEAESMLDSVPTALRERPDFLFRTGRCALARGRFAVAADALVACLEAGADSVAVRHDLAFALLGADRLDAAERVLASVLPRSPDEPAIALLHARLLQHRQQYEAAAAVAGAVVQNHPRHAEAWGLLAMLYLDLAQVADACDAAQHALSIDAAQSDALTTLGTLGLWSHDAQSAYQSFAQVLAAQPEAGRALAGAGEALMLNGDVPAAHAFLSRATDRMSQHIGTWHALAWCDLLLGNPAQAHAHFSKALDLDRNFGESHGGIALVHALNGHADEARSDIKRALRLDPQSRNARYAQSLLWSAEGRDREAAAMVDGILAEAGMDTTRRPVDFIQQLQARLRPAGRA